MFREFRGACPSLGNHLFGNMHYTYVLFSKKSQELYIGYTNNLRKRLAEHNAGKSIATKFKRPYVLVYFEAYVSEKDATLRERMLKKFAGSYMHLKKRIKNSLMISK